MERNWYLETKIYHDGSHYVGIPHTEKRYKKRSVKNEAIYVVRGNEEGRGEAVNTASLLPRLEIKTDEEAGDCPFDIKKNELKNEKEIPVNADMVSSFGKREEKRITKRVTRSSEFCRLYEECKEQNKTEQKEYIKKEIERLFKSEDEAEYYVEKKLRDKDRAYMERKKRFSRKAFLNDFNYFVTFTYDDKKQTEETFKKRLIKALRNCSARNGWKYMGVWEKGADTERLHFHAIVKVPEGEMKGELVEKNEYNVKLHRMEQSIQNTYFNERFGRTTFSEIIKYPNMYSSAVSYIMKYISKTGEKIVYSRKLPMYYISDIPEKEVLCRTGIEGRKIVLSDTFSCWEKGNLIGLMSEETKTKLRVANN